MYHRTEFELSLQEFSWFNFNIYKDFDTSDWPQLFLFICIHLSSDHCSMIVLRNPLLENFIES